MKRKKNKKSKGKQQSGRFLSIRVLNVNRLNILIVRLDEKAFVFKDSSLNLEFIDTNKVNFFFWKRKKTNHIGSNHRRVEIVLLISDKKSIRDKEGNFKMIKASVGQENML